MSLEKTRPGPDWDGWETWYNDILTDLHEMATVEGATVVRIRYKMGLRILASRQELIERRVITNERGWSGMLGELMDQLSADLGYSPSELYGALLFVNKFPSWKSFVKTVFEVQKAGGDSNAVRIPGGRLSWHQLIEHVLYRKIVICMFNSEKCGGDARRVEMCAHHRAELEAWQKARKVRVHKKG